MQITPAQLAATLNLVLHCARGRIGEAIEQSARATLDAWDAQQKAGQTDYLADDPEYAALVKAQLDIEAQITQAHQQAAWQRLHGATEASLAAAPSTRGGDGGTENGTEHSTHPTS